ncbi:thiamine pyrophosphate-dependent enzyme [Chloroflexota bacterium]
MAKRLALKDLAKQPERLAPGHRLCAGCGASIVVRQILAAIEEPVVIGNATGCLEVATTMYPYTAWQVPWIHNAFENVAATVSGVEAAYRSLVRQGKIPEQNVKFVAFGGDGGTYDIGLQSLSGAVERGHQFLYVCYDNGAYMNTGNQRSSATPYGAHTTTSPAGQVIRGKASGAFQVSGRHNGERSEPPSRGAFWAPGIHDRTPLGWVFTGWGQSPRKLKYTRLRVPGPSPQNRADDSEGRQAHHSPPFRRIPAKNTAPSPPPSAYRLHLCPFARRTRSSNPSAVAQSSEGREVLPSQSRLDIVAARCYDVATL